MSERGAEHYQPSIDSEIYSIESARDPHGGTEVLTEYIDEVVYGSRERRPRGNRFLIGQQGFECHFEYTISSDEIYVAELPADAYKLAVFHERTNDVRSAIEERYEVRIEEVFALTRNGSAVTSIYTIEKIRGEDSFRTWYELLGVKDVDAEMSKNTTLARSFGSIVDGQLDAREMCGYDINVLFDFMGHINQAQVAESREIALEKAADMA